MFKRAVGPVPNWPKVFKEWENSGQNQREFCAKRGYAYNQFRDARVKHARARRRGKKPQSNLVRQERQSSQEVSTKSGFFPFSLDKESPQASKVESQAINQAELEVKLPFGVVLTFRGVAN